MDANLAVVQHLRHHGFDGSIGVVAHAPEATRALQSSGADLTVNMFSASAEPFIARIAETPRG